MHLAPRHLAAWEREGLVTPDNDQTYTFEHLSQLRTLREVRSPRISARSIKTSVDAMQRVAGMSNPLLESSAVRRGSRIAFRVGGALVDPVTRQLAFDFETSPSRQMAVVRSFGRVPMHQTAVENAQLQEMFLRAVQLEEDPVTMPEAVRTYETILALRPEHAPACINLGTILYNRREFARAEQMYRRATEADPSYALAFFDLGNVLDEMQNLSGAVEAYVRAIVLVPDYADAHYNLALAYERQDERRRALRHWMAYVRLDPVGPWASHARAQARKILSMERLSIVSRSGRTFAAR